MVIGCGLPLSSAASQTWQPHAQKVHGELLFDEFLPLRPTSIYSEDENAAMAKKIDAIRFLTRSAKRHTIYNLFRFSREVGVGEAAPDFALKTTDGRVLRLSELRGKVAVFMFVAMTCPPARNQVPRWGRLRKKYSDDDVFFFLIYSRERHAGETGYPDFHTTTSDGEKMAYARRMDELSDLPIAVDDIAETVLHRYGQVPNAAYVVDGRGTIVFRSSWADSVKIEGVLDRLLASAATAASGHPTAAPAEPR